MGQRRGGHLKTRADPTFTTIFIDDFYPSFPPSDDDDDGDRISKGDNLKRNGTRPAPFERRAPTAEYRTRERTLAYISIPFTAPRRLGTALLALPIAIHRDSVSFSFFDRRSRSRSGQPARIIIIAYTFCRTPSSILEIFFFLSLFLSFHARRGSNEAPPRPWLLITGRTVKWNKIVENERSRERLE